MVRLSDFAATEAAQLVANQRLLEVRMRFSDMIECDALRFVSHSCIRMWLLVPPKGLSASRFGCIERFVGSSQNLLECVVRPGDASDPDRYADGNPIACVKDSSRHRMDNAFAQAANGDIVLPRHNDRKLISAKARA